MGRARGWHYVRGHVRNGRWVEGHYRGTKFQGSPLVLLAVLYPLGFFVYQVVTADGDFAYLKHVVLPLHLYLAYALIWDYWPVIRKRYRTVPRRVVSPSGLEPYFERVGDFMSHDSFKEYHVSWCEHALLVEPAVCIHARPKKDARPSIFTPFKLFIGVGYFSIQTAHSDYDTVVGNQAYAYLQKVRYEDALADFEYLEGYTASKNGQKYTARLRLKLPSPPGRDERSLPFFFPTWEQAAALQRMFLEIGVPVTAQVKRRTEYNSRTDGYISPEDLRYVRAREKKLHRSMPTS